MTLLVCAKTIKGRQRQAMMKATGWSGPRCRGCGCETSTSRTVCLDCGRQCNVCDGRFLWHEMRGPNCLQCDEVLRRLQFVHTRNMMFHDERERRVRLYADRQSAGLDLWTGEPLKSNMTGASR